MPLPPIVVNGKKGAYLQPPRYGRDGSGRFTVYTWHGTLAECLSNIPAIEASGGTWEMQESFTRARCELTARFPRDVTSGQQEVPEDDWELFTLAHEKDVLEADILGHSLPGIIGIVSRNNKEIIRGFINDPPKKGDNVVDQFVPDGSDAAAYILYKLMLMGLRSYIVHQQSLRHTQTSSQTYPIESSVANVRRIISPAKIVELEGIPNDIQIPFPSDQNPPVIDSTAGPIVLQYGWLKEPPTLRKSARKKIQLVQEWNYGLWPIAIYGNLVT